MDRRKWEQANWLLQETGNILAEHPMVIIKEKMLEGLLEERLFLERHPVSIGKREDKPYFYITSTKLVEDQIVMRRERSDAVAHRTIDNSIDINAKIVDRDDWVPENVFKSQLKVGSYYPLSHSYPQVSKRGGKGKRDTGLHGDIKDLEIDRADAFYFACDELFYLSACGTQWMLPDGLPGRSFPLGMTSWVSGRGGVGPGLLPDLHHLVDNPEVPVHFTGMWTYPHNSGEEPVELHGIAIAIPVGTLKPTEAVNGNYSRPILHDDDGTYRCPVCLFGQAEGKGKSDVNRHFSEIRSGAPRPRDFLPDLLSAGLIDLVPGQGYGLGEEFEPEINDIEGGQTQPILGRRYLQFGSITGEGRRFLSVLKELGEAPDDNGKAAKDAFERIESEIGELCRSHEYPIEYRMMCNLHRIAVVIGTSPENCPVCYPHEEG